MKKYTIKKGNHYCQFAWLSLFRMHWNKNLWSVKFKLDDNCWWSPTRNSDDYDINKLVGIGFGFNHHKNSWRLGWVPNFIFKNHFKLFAYAYDTNTGQHVSVEMGDFISGVIYDCKIESKNNKYYFSCSNIGQAEIDNNLKDSKLEFELNFYHGGNNTAPNDETALTEIIC